MKPELTIEVQGVAVDDDDLIEIGDYQLSEVKRFEGHGEIFQIVVPLATAGYLMLSRVLTFIERLLDKAPTQDVRIRVFHHAAIVGCQIKEKGDLRTVGKALEQLAGQSKE